jgi:hypothetical protein
MRPGSTMKQKASIMIVLDDHNSRVDFRKMVEGAFDLAIISVANPIEGLSVLQKIKPPAFILLSSQGLPLMTYQEFINQKERNVNIANIPLILLSTAPVTPLPKGVNKEVKAPISMEDLRIIIKKYCLS